MVSWAALIGCGRVGVEVLPAPGSDGSLGPPRDAMVSLDGDISGIDAAEPGLADASAADAASSEAGVGEGGAASDASADAAACALDPSCDVCSVDPNAHVPDSSCGVGYCRLHNAPSRCSAGVEVACLPAAPRSLTDATCDGIDDDCDGQSDEDYVATSTSCGRGVCVRSGMRTCQSGSAIDSCVPGAPSSAPDDPSGSGNGQDDDCDGSVDEDVPGCDTAPRRFAAGNHTNVAVPAGCGRVTVRLWGAGGAGGSDVGVLGSGGEGGAGGYTTFSGPLSGSISILVGQGGPGDCSSEGTNAGAGIYNGGSGGTGSGNPGSDGVAVGGGSGGTPNTGRAGGRGHFGGGGGGQGSGGLGASGEGGGGGAASVFMMNGTRLAVAGGGGGGGGAQSISVLGTLAAAGGSGGSGCGGAGAVATANGGGGGGGGLCLGTASQAGAGPSPVFGEDLPAGSAAGGARGCGAGGAGHAIVTFSR